MEAREYIKQTFEIIINNNNPLKIGSLTLWLASENEQETRYIGTNKEQDYHMNRLEIRDLLSEIKKNRKLIIQRKDAWIIEEPFLHHSS